MPASKKGITPKGTKCDVGPKRKAGARAIKRVNKKTTKHVALKRTAVSVCRKLSNTTKLSEFQCSNVC